MLRIERLAVTASLDHPAPALNRAQTEADAGDPSWQEWLADYDHGQAIVVSLDVTLQVNDGRSRTIEISNDGVFVEAHPHPPIVERQIAEIVSKDFSLLAGQLSEMGHRLEPLDLAELYVHVEIDEDIRRALRTAETAEGSRLSAFDGARADARFSRHRGPAEA